MAKTNRFGKLVERSDKADFPFYNGKPVELKTWQWIAVILSCIAGFVALSVIGWESETLKIIPRFLFTAIPLITFIYMAGDNWKAIFKPFKKQDIKTIIGFWLLYFVVSLAVAAIASGGDLKSFTANRATDTVLEQGTIGVIGFYIGTFVQLFGEELFTILPFLAFMYWLYTKGHLSRKTSVMLTWLVTSVYFGAAHLPTYDWNFVQAIFVIGSARLVLSMAYIRTKNILVAFGTHLLSDWSIFTFTLLASSLHK